MWQCPKCRREFRKKNQEHSCEVISIEDHLVNRPSTIIDSFRKVSDYLIDLGDDVKVTPVKNTILFSVGSSFAAVKPRKSFLQIEFALAAKVETFPVFKVLQISKSKYLHYVRIEKKEEFNTQIKEWLAASYLMEKS